MKQTNTTSNSVASEFDTAEMLMAYGRWDEAETVLRKACQSQADLTLRLALLEWRRQCVAFASTLDLDDDEGAKQTLENNYDCYVTDWVLNSYKG